MAKVRAGDSQAARDSKGGDVKHVAIQENNISVPAKVILSSAIFTLVVVILLAIAGVITKDELRIKVLEYLNIERIEEPINKAP
jgi:hypothetical protein